MECKIAINLNAAFILMQNPLGDAEVINAVSGSIAGELYGA